MTTNELHAYVSSTSGLPGRNLRTERREDYCRLLVEATQISKTSADFYRVLDAVLDSMLKISQADAAVMVLSDDDGDFQFVGGRHANGKKFTESDMRFVPALANRLRGNEDIITVYNAAEDAGVRNDKVFGSQYLRAVIGLRVASSASVIGFVQLGSHSALPRLEDFELSILTSLAAVLSLKTDNALAYSQMEQLREIAEEELRVQTEQLTEANKWLANALERAERQLAEKRRAEHALTLFANRMSHELRAPAQLILGHAHLALEDGTARLSSLQRSSLGCILKASEHIGTLLARMDDPSKLDDGGFIVDPVPLDVRPLINETLAFCRGLTTGQPIQLLYYYPPELPNVLGDATCIRQVLINLLANACRFTRQGKISVNAAVKAGYVVISVSDTGLGIAPDRLKTLFEQDDPTQGGTGLGLPISKQLVELHGGQLWAQSTPDKGSTFRFSLPCGGEEGFVIDKRPSQQAKHIDGLTSAVFVEHQNGDATFVVGGISDEGNQWSRTITLRAAHHLWFHLTRLLFPEKSNQVVGMAQTAPLSGDTPLITTQLEVVQNPETRLYEILGWVGDETWWFRVDDQNARKLWTALDVALYPAGWSGPVISHNKCSGDKAMGNYAGSINTCATYAAG